MSSKSSATIAIATSAKAAARAVVVAAANERPLWRWRVAESTYWYGNFF